MLLFQAHYATLYHKTFENKYRKYIISSREWISNVVTNNPDNKNPNKFKKNVREQYIDFYPPLGNILHSSDSSDYCEKELGILFDENINNFKNIGTYYSQKMI